MPQSLSNLAVHLVFSTKDRRPWLRDGERGQLHAYLIGILQNLGCPSIETGSVTDHVHILFQLSRTKTLAAVVEEIKTSSSKWLKTLAAHYADFHWQRGYSAFSVSASAVERVRTYIRNQAAHHARKPFQDEVRALLRRSGLEFDERYVWD